VLVDFIIANFKTETVKMDFSKNHILDFPYFWVFVGLPRTLPSSLLENFKIPIRYNYI